MRAEFIFPSSMSPHGRQARGIGPDLPISHSSGLAHLCLHEHDQLNFSAQARSRVCSPEYCSWGGARSILPSAVASEGRGHLCRTLSFWPLTVTGERNINTDSSSPGPDITITLAGK